MSETAEKTMELYCIHSDEWESRVGDVDLCEFMDTVYQDYMNAGETLPRNDDGTMMWDDKIMAKVAEQHALLWQIHTDHYGPP